MMPGLSSDHTVLTYSPMTAAIYHRYIRSRRGALWTWNCGRRLRGWCSPICAIRAHLGLTSHTSMTAAPTCSHDDFTYRRACAVVVFGRSSCFAVPVMRRASLRRRRGFAIGTWWREVRWFVDDGPRWFMPLVQVPSRRVVIGSRLSFGTGTAWAGEAESAPFVAICAHTMLSDWGVRAATW